KLSAFSHPFATFARTLRPLRLGKSLLTAKDAKKAQRTQRKIANQKSKIANSTMSDFLKTLRERVIVFDGAMGTNLHAQGLTVEDYGGPQFENCNEHLLLTRPDAVERVHAGFLEVGCDLVETDSFNGTTIVLGEFGIAHMAYDLNLRAARLARRVASDFSTADRPRWVAGSMGPGTKLPTLGHVTFLETRDAYGEQARGLLDGGVDLLIVETCQDLLQLKAALMGIFREFKRRGSRVPVIAQVTIEQQGTMLLGTEIGAALTAVEPFPIDVFGMNCATGPQQMAENVRYLCQNSKFPVSIIPNAGIPDNVGGHAVFRETPESLAAELSHFARDLGVS